MNNESLLLSFFNQYLFNEAKQNIEHIEYFYQTNPSTMGNPFIAELIGAIKNYNLDAIGEPLFRSILMRSQKTPQESDEIMKEVIKLKQCSREEIAPAAKDMRDVISTAIIRKASAKFSNSSSDFLKYLKNVNVNTGDLEVFSSTSFDKIDINSIIADSANSVIKTNVGMLNRAFPCGGIEAGQIFCISASPGSGKTLFSMNLALYFASQGIKCLYVSLADQSTRDMIIRSSAIINGNKFSDAYADLRGAYESVARITGSNLEISINSAGTVTADQIVEKALKDNIQCTFVDYDSCLKVDNGKNSDSMYNNFGDAYNTFTKLSMAGKNVFICSQPKVTSWQSGQNGGIISLGDLSDSSRKSHIADVVLTISKISGEDTPHNIFLAKLVKARRGRNLQAYFYRNQARFIEIPKGLADQLKMETEDREYTDQQILAMAERYKQSEQAVQQAVKQEQQRRQYDNPFT